MAARTLAVMLTLVSLWGCAEHGEMGNDVPAADFVHVTVFGHGSMYSMACNWYPSRAELLNLWWHPIRVETIEVTLDSTHSIPVAVTLAPFQRSKIELHEQQLKFEGCTQTADARASEAQYLD